MAGKILFQASKKNVILRSFRSCIYSGSSIGEMAEWLKAHAWKVCVLQKGTAGSNPALSAFSRLTDSFDLKLLFFLAENGINTKH